MDKTETINIGAMLLRIQALEDRVRNLEMRGAQIGRQVTSRVIAAPAREYPRFALWNKDEE